MYNNDYSKISIVATFLLIFGFAQSLDPMQVTHILIFGLREICQKLIGKLQNNLF